MIRPIAPADTETLVALTADTGVFKPLELVALREVFDDYYKENEGLGHRSFVWEVEGRILGYVYHAPTPMTEGTWHLYWIAVDKSQQGRGLGRQLLEFVENDVRGQGGRVLLIETSMLERYEPTRRFYHKYGYTQAAVIPDYYSEGDGMAVYMKRIGVGPITVDHRGE